MADEIHVTGLEFDTRRFEDAIRRAERRLDELEDTTNRGAAAARKAENDFEHWGRAAIGLAASYGILRAAVGAGEFIFETNKEFEQLEARLVAVEGSAEGAARAFSLITDFARETPFEVQNLTQAFTMLRAAGITPTVDMLRGVGNFAAAMGRDISDAIEAILRASQGGTERLRESFFIPIQKDGNTLRITWRGVTTAVGADVGELLGFFQQLGETDFAGGMEKQMGTMEGAISNLKDSSALLAREIGRAGVNGEVSELVKTLDDAIRNGDAFAKVLAGPLVGGLEVANEVAEAFVRHIELIAVGIGMVGGALAGGATLLGIAGLTTAIGALIALNPVAWFLTLSGLLGGVLVQNILDARVEVERLADAGQKLASIPLPDVTGMDAAELDKQIALLQRRQGLLKAWVAQDGLKADRDALHAITGQIQQLIAAKAALGTGGTGGGGGDPEAVARMATALQQQRIELEQGERAAFAYELSLTKMSAAERQHALALYDSVQAAKIYRDAQDAAAQQFEDAIAAAQANLDAIRASNRGLDEQLIRLREGEAGLLRYTLAKRGATDAEIDEQLAKLHSIEALERANEAAEEAARTAEQQREAFQAEMASIGDRLTSDLVEPLLEFIKGTGSAGDAFSEMVTRMLNDILRLTLQKTLTDTLSSALAAGLGSAFGGAAGGGQGVSADLSQPVYAGSAASQMVSVGATDPTQPVVVSPAASLAPAVSGGGVATPPAGQTVVHQEINFQISAMDGRDAARFLRENGGEIAGIVLEAARGSESYRQAMLG